MIEDVTDVQSRHGHEVGREYRRVAVLVLLSVRPQITCLG